MSDYDSKNQKHTAQSVIAYFSMEVGIDPSLPTYSGGLGILAGGLPACRRRFGRTYPLSELFGD